MEVPRDADDDAIKKAYRKAALRLHPDKCQLDGSKEAFRAYTPGTAPDCLSTRLEQCTRASDSKPLVQL